MHTFVNQLDIHPVPPDDSEMLGESPSLSVENVVGLSVAILVPCFALASVSLSGLFPAPIAAIEAVIIPASTVFVPTLGICIVLATAAGYFLFAHGLYARFRGRCLVWADV